jgi:hypothetical protein
LAKALGALVSIATAAHAQPIELHELPDHTTEATIVVAATPDEVYAVVTDYRAWPRIFTDVVAAKVQRGGRDDARVRFSSRTFGQTVTVEFDNEPGAYVRFRGVKGPPGGRARGEYVLTALPEGRTQIRARLYMDVAAPASWFVRDKTVREMRRAKLEVDLRDTARLFGAD